MTALKEYARLESTGLWRATADGQRREVGVLFGAATLVITDAAGRPLSHWSMPAMHRANPGQMPALYMPAMIADEQLELADELMVGAIDKVLRTVARRIPRPGRLRQAGVAFVLSAMAGLALFWLPGALLDQTLRVIPQVKRAEIGATLLGHLQRLTSATCRDPLGTQALGQLSLRLFGSGGGQIVVIPEGLDGGLDRVLDLPGGIIVLGQAMLAATDDPAVLAGQILAVTALRAQADPLDRLLRGAGLMTTLRLLTSGDVPGDIIQDHATALLTAAPDRADADLLFAAFQAAQVPLAPYATALDPLEETLPDLSADPLETAPGPEILPEIRPEILSDGDWISLQGICG